MRYWIFLSVYIIGFASWSCDLEREIEIDLPAYESRTIVECYLIPNDRFELLLTRSAAYFEPFPEEETEFLENILLDSADVRIKHNGTEYQLFNFLYFNPFTSKLFNYFSPEYIPEDYDNDFELIITTADGETITATTRMLRPIPIDSLVVEFEDEEDEEEEERDSLARILTYFTDSPGEENFFRRMVHFNSVDSLPDQDFTADDRVVEEVVVFGTGYDYRVGDTLIHTLFNIERSYYDFLESVEIASNSNGNPFAQPSPIAGNIKSDRDAFGIFTALTWDRDTAIIKE